jgi:hypothetical protein
VGFLFSKRAKLASASLGNKKTCGEAAWVLSLSESPKRDHEIIPLSADELKTHDFSWVLSSSEQANAVNDLLKISYNTTPTVYA